jgi:hypothetical protein
VAGTAVVEQIRFADWAHAVEAAQLAKAMKSALFPILIGLLR